MSIDGKIVTDCSELLKFIAGDSRVTQDWGRLFDHNIVPYFFAGPFSQIDNPEEVCKTVPCRATKEISKPLCYLPRGHPYPEEAGPP